MEKSYSIGQMADLCRVSAKQLRYYDNNGILSPALRDGKTGYRFYREDQIEEVLLIQELRGIGISLSSIGNLLNDRDLSSLKRELEEALPAVRAELDQARYRYDRLMEVLLRVLKAMDHINVSSGAPAGTPRQQEVRLLDVPPRTVAFTRRVSSWSAESTRTVSIFVSRRAELYEIVKQYGLHMTGANMAIFHSGYRKQFSGRPEDGEGDLEVCVTVDNLSGHCPCCRTIPAFRAVSAIHVGPYRNMEPCYLRMELWAKENGIRLSGLSLEEYLVNASMTQDSQNYVTRLYLPIEGCGL